MRDTEGDSDERENDELHGGLRDAVVPDDPAARGRRSSDASLTAERLQVAWPDLSRSLHRYLRSRGASPHDAEDITQAVALKVLAETRPIRSLTAWSLTAARNLHIDLLRKASREGAVAPRLQSASDPADIACSRDECERSLAAISAWREEDRRLIVQAVNRDRLAEDRTAATRRHVRVHRLRRRLHAEIHGPVAAFVALLLEALRRRRVVGLAVLPVAIATPMLLLPAFPNSGRSVSSPEVQAAVSETRPPFTEGEMMQLQSTSFPNARGVRLVGEASKNPLPPSKTSPLPRHAKIVHETRAGTVGVETHPSDRRGNEIFCAKDVLPGVPEQCIRDPR